MAFAHQVAGHPSTLRYASEDDTSTVIKPCLPVEKTFYETLGHELGPDFIGEWTPAFYGTLKLQGQVGEGGGIEAAKGDVDEEAIVLENLTYRFEKPNVMDIKLGTQLWDEGASQEKRDRLTKASNNTTSGTTGIRLTGFKTWNPATKDYESTDKLYGKALKAEQLYEGFSRFFPSAALSGPEQIPTEQLLAVLHYFQGRVAKLQEIFATYECRIRSGSLLLVYEGDPAVLTASIERTSKGAAPTSPDLASEGSTGTTSTTDEARLVPCSLRMIDFAHFSKVPGQGPDEGLVLGLKTTKELLDKLIAEVEAKP